MTTSERLWQRLGDVDLVFLWIRELSDDTESRARSTAVDEVNFPLFVATTRDPANFQTPGFERGGVSLLVSPELTVRLVADRGLPLPVLSAMIKKLLTNIVTRIGLRTHDLNLLKEAD